MPFVQVSRLQDAACRLLAPPKVLLEVSLKRPYLGTAPALGGIRCYLLLVKA